MSYKVNVPDIESRMIHEYKCANDHLFKELSYRSDIVYCPDCGEQGARQIGKPRLDWRMGTDPSSSRGDAWARMHREEAKRARERDGE